MIEHGFEEFFDLLRAEGKEWSDLVKDSIANNAKRPGVRCVQFSGDLLRAALAQDMATLLIQGLKSQMPEDAAVWMAAAAPAFHGHTHMAGHYDSYSICFISREWEGPEEGGAIPMLKYYREGFAEATPLLVEVDKPPTFDDAVRILNEHQHRIIKPGVTKWISSLTINSNDKFGDGGSWPEAALKVVDPTSPEFEDFEVKTLDAFEARAVAWAYLKGGL